METKALYCNIGLNHGKVLHMEIENEINVSASPNYAQLQAIQTTECPLLIIAGPGSGKTFTLVERACYLIVLKNVPLRILK